MGPSRLAVLLALTALLVAPALPVRALECEPCSADIDGDGRVGGSDFILLGQQFGGPPSGEHNADVDGDGLVGGNDWIALAVEFGQDCYSACPANTPMDRDGDGAMDYVLCGDFDGDGQLTMDRGCVNANPSSACDADGEKGDLLACLEALDDEDGRTLEILPGRYEVPDEPFTAHNHWKSSTITGLLELPSNTRVHCRPGAVLTGTDERHLDYVDVVSVLSIPRTSANVIVENCEIDQGWPDGYDCGGGACDGFTRMGINVAGDDHVIRENWIHHTSHACIYAKRARGLVFEHNEVDWCGGSWSPNPPALYPGVYLFSDAGEALEQTQVLNTRCDRTGASCISTRLGWQNDDNAIEDLLVRGTVQVRSGPNADGAVPRCVTLSGLTDTEVSDTRCVGTNGIQIVGGEARYLDDPGCSRPAGTWLECSNANANLVLRDAVIEENVSQTPLSLGARSTDLRVENVTVLGSPANQACARALGPYRRLEVDGLSLHECGRGGFYLGNSAQPGDWGDADPDEAVTLRRVDVDTADAWLVDSLRGSALSLASGCVGCTFEEISLSGWSDYGFNVSSNRAFVDNLVVDLTLRQMGSWYAGEASLADLPACDAANAGQVVTRVDAPSTASCAPVGGSASNLCVCDGASWQDAELISAVLGASPGLRLLGADPVAQNVLNAIACHEVRAQSHCVQVGSNAVGDLLSGILAFDSRGLGDFHPDAHDANNGAVDLNGASSVIFGASCEGLRNDETTDGRRCICYDEACTY
ncbi:MAG: hypothetical protein QNK04_15110 [Myxococcota bacterium]|nr:hypothetical protein [Myxococcota bacterium]